MKSKFSVGQMVRRVRHPDPYDIHLFWLMVGNKPLKIINIKQYPKYDLLQFNIPAWWEDQYFDPVVEDVNLEDFL